MKLLFCPIAPMEASSASKKRHQGEDVQGLGGTMKVSNNVNITRIYQDQVKKTKTENSGSEFNKIMQDSVSKTETTVKSFSAPSGISSINPVLTGTPVTQSDPVQTAQFAAEVVANEPDVRAEKVDRIKKLFDSGQYNIAPEAIAEKLFASGAVTASWEG